jgi:hypothetical protein
MPKNAKFKHLVRTRMEQTGETYTQARDGLLLAQETPAPVAAPMPEPVAAPSTLDLIREVLDAHPNLCYTGWRFVHPRHEQKMAEREASRQTLLSEVGVREVEACREFLRPLRRLRNANPARSTTAMSSYGLKHVVEHECREAGDDLYVANGSLIVAAMLEGFATHRSWGSGPNCSVGVASGDVRKEQLRREAVRKAAREAERRAEVRAAYAAHKNDPLAAIRALRAMREGRASPAPLALHTRPSRRSTNRFQPGTGRV